MAHVRSMSQCLAQSHHSHDISDCKGEGGFIPPMYIALHASRSTIEIISLPFLDFDEDDDSPIWSLHFPRLRRLELGDLQFRPHDDASASGFGFGRFLNTNPSIEELQLGNIDATSLGISTPPDIPTGHGARDANSDQVGPDCLPSLKVFTGSVAAFAQLAAKGLKCLQTKLTKLELFTDEEDTVDAAEAIFQHLAAYTQSNVEDRKTSSVLTVLKEVRFVFDGDIFFEGDHMEDFIRGWAKVCGDSLEVWDGLIFPSARCNKRIGHLFSSFSNLKVLRLCECLAIGHHSDDEGTPAGQNLFSYVTSLASQCQTLECVRMDCHQDCGLIHSFRIVRQVTSRSGRDGRGIQVQVYEELVRHLDKYIHKHPSLFPTVCLGMS